MDQSKVKAIVVREFRYLRARLALQAWVVSIEYGTIEGNPVDGIKGMCWANPKYETARILLDPYQLEDEEDVKFTIRHEMLHLFHADIHLLRQVVMASIPNEDGKAAVEPVYETLDGWDQSTRGARSWAQLPATAIKYVRRIEELIETPVALLSTSPERQDTILVRDPFMD